MESAVHAQLKRIATVWLHVARARAVASEVRTAIPLWRADVAGWFEGPADAPMRLSRREVEADARQATSELPWRDEDPVARLQVQAGAVDLFGEPSDRPDSVAVRRMMAGVTTVLVECKASRADFLSDGDDLDEAVREHARLRARLDRMHHDLLPRWEPHLRRKGETLFELSDGWDTARSRLQSVREARRDERLARLAVQGRVKFDRMARWRLADRLYLCCPGGLVRASELPQGWGLLEVTRGAMRVSRIATALACPPARRWRTVLGVARRSDRSA